MHVSDAVEARRSTRAFTSEPVADEVIAELLVRASRAPSGGNLQPWRVYVIGTATMPDFLEHLTAQPAEAPAYDVYPANLWEPYRSNRFQMGEQMYELLGIGRSERDARIARFGDNYRFFGAPAAIFCFIDRGMGRPQWSDLGMFLQTFMLLATEAGLDTCPQEAWSAWPRAVGSFVGAPEEETIFCAVAIGHAERVPVNDLRSERMPLEEWATFVPPRRG